MASITIAYRKDKLNKDEKAPIHIRIIKDRKIRYLTTGVMLEMKYWDFKANKVKSSYKNSARLNSFLTSKLSELQDNVLEAEQTHKSLTTAQLKEKINGKKPIGFIQFAREVNKRVFESGKIGTFDKNQSIITKLEVYNKGKILYFQDITPSFLTNYEDYLRNTLGNGVNTINTNLRYIRKLFNDAYREGLIDHSTIPFLKYKLKTEKSERMYLTEEELHALENTTVTLNTKMELHKDIFLFAAETAGIRISDLLQLRRRNFDGKHLHLTTQKTQTQMAIKVPNKGLAIINKYISKTGEPNDFLFPALILSPTETDLRRIDNALSSATAYMNKNLKLLATKAKIEKKISTHIARHSFATRALRKGIPIQNVSKLLGHAAIKETQIYAKIVGEDLDKSMEVFND